MAQFTRIEVAQTMKESGMVPLFFHSDVEVAKKVLKACFVNFVIYSFRCKSDSI
jgi:2-dehydro-3-deoxyphosphogluconate aldolase/(4S)-4-hydroxy-2-oxoglutarate aldolase